MDNRGVTASISVMTAVNVLSRASIAEATVCDGSSGGGPSVAATQPWGLDSLSDGGEDFDDADMQDIAGGARESVIQAIGIHNDAILYFSKYFKNLWNVVFAKRANQ